MLQDLAEEAAAHPPGPGDIVILDKGAKTVHVSAIPGLVRHALDTEFPDSAWDSVLRELLHDGGRSNPSDQCPECTNLLAQLGFHPL